MHNPYHHIRYFPQDNKFAIMDSERKDANIRKTDNEILVYNSLGEAIKARDSK